MFYSMFLIFVFKHNEGAFVIEQPIERLPRRRIHAEDRDFAFARSKPLTPFVLRFECKPRFFLPVLVAACIVELLPTAWLVRLRLVPAFSENEPPVKRTSAPADS